MAINRLRILVIGGLAAGPSAAAKAKRINPDAEVILFEASDNVSYAICESPYVIRKTIDDENKLVIFTPDKLASEKGIIVKTLHTVEKILPASRKIVVRDLRNHKINEYGYDKLIICTGSISRRLNIDGEDGRNVFNLKTREDTLNILNYLSLESPKNAVIVGGGYIAMEMAEAFRSRGLEVTLLHQFDLPMEGLERETREYVLEELKRNDVQFIPNVKVEAFQKDPNGKVRYVITNRGSFEVDIVLLSIGFIPNVELAQTARIRLGSFGGIVTDEQQRTNVDHIYAAGDCCELKNIVTGKPMYLPLATVASRTAWVAGENAAGGKAIFKGAIRAIAVKLFDTEIAQVGLGSEEAKNYGFKVVTTLIDAPSKVEIMAGSEKIHIHLIYNKISSRLFGANVYGKEGVMQRVNVLGAAIQQKLTLDEVSRLDMIYAPLFTPLWDPILIAANRAKKEFKL